MVTCAIIGLGQIGYQYDADINQENIKLTHTSTINSISEFELKFAIEIDRSKRLEFEYSTGIQTFESIGLLPSNFKIRGVELLIIATPPSLHLTNFQEALALRPRAVLFEKPLAQSLLDAQRIDQLAAENGVELFINYQRNYIPAFQEIRNKIIETSEPKRFNLSGWFQGDLLNSGSHLIALIDSIFPGYLNNYMSSDRFGSHFEFKQDMLTLNLNRVDQLQGSIFSLEIVTSNFLARYDSHLESVSFSFPGEDKTYKNQLSLQAPTYTISTMEANCMQFVYKEILNYFNGSRYYSYGAKNAIFVMDFVMNLMNEKSGGQ
jgi:hypothetical protein